MIKISIALILLIVFNSCASIISRTNYEVRVNSVPANAMVSIFDRDGNEVFTGSTPCQVTLKSSAGYFKKAIYTIEFNKEGFARRTFVLKANLNEWYFGNLIFGGWIGMLIVDPLTGAMYKLKNFDINESLDLLSTRLTSKKTLVIYPISQIPPGWKDNLVEVTN